MTATISCGIVGDPSSMVPTSFQFYYVPPAGPIASLSVTAAAAGGAVVATLGVKSFPYLVPDASPDNRVFVALGSYVASGSTDGVTVSFTVPPLTPPGTYQVGLSINGGADYDLSPGAVLTVLAPPAVTAISPVRGSRSSVTPVTVYGQGFVDSILCVVGGVSGSPSVRSGFNSVTCAAGPSVSDGSTTVEVSLPGLPATKSGIVFTFSSPASLSSISPTTVSYGGGYRVTVTGTGFQSSPDSRCKFTLVTDASKFLLTPVALFKSSTELVCVSPDFTSLVATTSFASSAIVDFSLNGIEFTGSTGTLLTLVQGPTVTSVNPASSNGLGNTVVTIYGSNLVGSAGVTMRCMFPPFPAVPVTFGSPDGDFVVCRAPVAGALPLPRFATTARVAVNGNDYTTDNVPFIFTESARVTAVVPRFFARATQEPVTLYGSGFADVDVNNRLQVLLSGCSLLDVALSSSSPSLTFLPGNCSASLVDGPHTLQLTANGGADYVTEGSVSQVTVVPPITVSASTAMALFSDSPAAQVSPVLVNGNLFINSGAISCRWDLSALPGGTVVVLAGSYVSRTSVLCPPPPSPPGFAVSFAALLSVSNNGAHFLEAPPISVNFVDVPVPALQDPLSPSLGPDSGGTVVTLSGTHFPSAAITTSAVCTFTVIATGIPISVPATILSGGVATCTVPPSTAASSETPVPARVTFSAFTALENEVLFGTYNYLPGVFLVSISPSRIPIAPVDSPSIGLMPVTVTGSSPTTFDTSAGQIPIVSIGSSGNPACTLTPSSLSGSTATLAIHDVQLCIATLAIPGGTAFVDLSSLEVRLTRNGVAGPAGPSVSLRTDFLPTVTDVFPTAGYAGTTLTVKGTNFFPDPALKCAFSTNDAPVSVAATYISSSLMLCAVPATANGASISVQMAGAGSGVPVPKTFSMFPSRPTCTLSSPIRVSAAGGTVFTVSGTGFYGSAPQAAFSLDGVANSRFVQVPAALAGGSTVSVVAPALEDASLLGVPAVVSLSFNGGADWDTCATNLLAYFTDPVISGLAPKLAAASSFTVTITGSGFLVNAPIDAYCILTPEDAGSGGAPLQLLATTKTAAAVECPCSACGATPNSYAVALSVNNKLSSRAFQPLVLVDQPVIQGLVPKWTLLSRATDVTVIGNSFPTARASAVTCIFDNLSFPAARVVDARRVVCQAPLSGTQRIVPAAVRLNFDGLLVPSDGSSFTYAAPPAFWHAYPDTGPLAGGTAVTLTFAGDLVQSRVVSPQCRFGTQIVSGSLVVPAGPPTPARTQIRCTAPASLSPTGSVVDLAYSLNADTVAGIFSPGTFIVPDWSYTYYAQPRFLTLAPTIAGMNGGTPLLVGLGNVPGDMFSRSPQKSLDPDAQIAYDSHVPLCRFVSQANPADTQTQVLTENPDHSYTCYSVDASSFAGMNTNPTVRVDILFNGVDPSDSFRLISVFPTPIITSLFPVIVPVTGNTNLAVNVQQPLPGAAVILCRFAPYDVEIAAFVPIPVTAALISPTMVMCTIPAWTATPTGGVFAVSVSVNDGVEYSAPAGLLAVPAPQVVSISPTSCSTEGNCQIIVTGLNLIIPSVSTYFCRFGSLVSPASVVPGSTDEISCLSPAIPLVSPAGVPVEVSYDGINYFSNPSVTLATTAAPRVQLLNPNNALSGGGDVPIEIAGANFPVGNPSVKARLGTGAGAPVVSAVVVTTTQITCTIPDSQPGLYPLEISVNGGYDFTSDLVLFSYTGTVNVVESLTPRFAAQNGATVLRIGGRGFSLSVAYECQFFKGGLLGASAASVISATELRCPIQPSPTAGAATVQVGTKAGAVFTPLSTFNFYYTTPHSFGTTLTPLSSGPRRGGTVVTLTAADDLFFTTGGAPVDSQDIGDFLWCRFGPLRLSPTKAVAVGNSWACVSPPATGITLGSVNIFVTNNLVEYVQTGAQFTYREDERILQLVPNVGSHVGGLVTVTLFGINFDTTSSTITCFYSGAAITDSPATVLTAPLVQPQQVECSFPDPGAGASFVGIELSYSGLSSEATKAGFTYVFVDPPVISSFAPLGGPFRSPIPAISAAESTLVTIFGSGFTGASTLACALLEVGVGRLRPVPGPSSVPFTATFVDSGHVLCSIPVSCNSNAGPLATPGAYTLQLSVDGSAWASSPSSFTYFVAPAITGMVPSNVPVSPWPSGLVTLQGTFPTGVALPRVRLSPSVELVSCSFSPTELVCSAPQDLWALHGRESELVALEVAVSLNNAGSWTVWTPPVSSPPLSFFPVPEVTAVSPSLVFQNAAPAPTLTLYGSNFWTLSTPPACIFSATESSPGFAQGSTPASPSSLTEVSCQISSTATAGAVLADLAVSGDAASKSRSGVLVTVIPNPTVSSLAPAVGRGGTLVTLTGSSPFSSRSGATCVFDFGLAGTESVSARLYSADKVVCAAPAYGQGEATVIFTYVDVGLPLPAPVPGKFNYLADPAATTVVPTFGPESGGFSITLTGSGFTASTVVSLGHELQPTCSLSNPTTIVCASVTEAPLRCEGRLGATPVRLSVNGVDWVESDVTVTYTPVWFVESVEPQRFVGNTAITLSSAGFASAFERVSNDIFTSGVKCRFGVSEFSGAIAVVDSAGTIAVICTMDPVTFALLAPGTRGLLYISPNRGATWVPSPEEIEVATTPSLSSATPSLIPTGFPVDVLLGGLDLIPGSADGIFCTLIDVAAGASAVATFLGSMVGGGTGILCSSVVSSATSSAPTDYRLDVSLTGPTGPLIQGPDVLFYLTGVVFGPSSPVSVPLGSPPVTVTLVPLPPATTFAPYTDASSVKCVWSSTSDLDTDGNPIEVQTPAVNAAPAPPDLTVVSCPTPSEFRPRGKYRVRLLFNDRFLTNSPDEIFFEFVSCTAGAYCPAGATLPQQCSPGHYCLGEPFERPCPPGTYQPDAGRTACLPCDRGFYCNAHALASPVQCPAGFLCNATSLLEPAAPCPPGHYCRPGTLTGDPLAAGTSYIHNAVTYPGKPLPCGAAVYCPGNVPAFLGVSPMGQVAGTFVSPGITSARKCFERFQCTAGEATAQGSGACQLGYQCPTDSPPTPCPQGRFAGSRGQIACDPCPLGSFQNATGRSACDKCPRGFQCPSLALALPVPCPAGYVCSLEGTISANVPCPAGFYCPAGVAFVSRAAAAAAGVPAASVLDSQLPIPCPAGFYCVQGVTTGEPWPAGTVLLSNATIAESQLFFSRPQPCVAGTFCAGGAATQLGTGACPRGYYCPPGTIKPIPARLGRYSPVTGLTEDLPCPSGTYSDASGLSQCWQCPPGYMCQGAGLQGATLCPAGQYRALGQNNGEYCSPCPLGSLDMRRVTFPPRPQSDSLGEAVLTNYTAPVPPSAPGFRDFGLGLASIASPSYRLRWGEITARFDGKVTLASASAAVANGNYLLRQAFLGSNAYTLIEWAGAANGTESPSWWHPLALGSVETCAPCPAGFVCDATGMSDLGLPALCPEGRVCDRGSTSLTTRYCPAGYFCHRGTDSSSQEAHLCPAGRYCPSGTAPGQVQGTTATNLCRTNFYCPAGSTSAADPLFECPEQTSSSVGSSKYFDCVSTNDAERRTLKEEKAFLKPLPSVESSQGSLLDDSGRVACETLGTLQLNIDVGKAKEDGLSYGSVFRAAIYHVTTSTGSTVSELRQNIMAAAPAAYRSAAYHAALAKAGLVRFGEVRSVTKTVARRYSLADASPSSANTTATELQQDTFYRLPPPLRSLDSSVENASASAVFSVQPLRDTLRIEVLIEVVNGLYVANSTALFADLVSYEVLAPSRSSVQPYSFLAVLPNDEKIELPLNLITPTPAAGATSIDMRNKSDAAIPDAASLATGLGTVSASFDTETSGYAEKYTSVKADRAKIFPTSKSTALVLPYLPYFSACAGYDSYVTLFRLLESEQCRLAGRDQTVWAIPWSPATVPEGDVCDYGISCQYEERLDRYEFNDRWFEVPDGTTVFYITSEPADTASYAADGDGGWSKKIGSRSLIPVVVRRSAVTAGRVPRTVTLSLRYQQVTEASKRILVGELLLTDLDDVCRVEGTRCTNDCTVCPDSSGAKSTRDVPDLSYSFKLHYAPLPYVDLLVLFAFDMSLYVTIFVCVALFTLFTVILFWLVHKLIYRGKLASRLRFRSYVRLNVLPHYIAVLANGIPIGGGLVIIWWLFGILVNDVIGHAAPGDFSFYNARWGTAVALTPRNVEAFATGRYATALMAFSAIVLYSAARIFVPDREPTLEETTAAVNYKWTRAEFLVSAAAMIVLQVIMIELSYQPMFASWVFLIIPCIAAFKIFLSTSLLGLLKDRLLVDSLILSFTMCQYIITMGAGNYFLFVAAFILTMWLDILSVMFFSRWARRKLPAALRWFSRALARVRGESGMTSSEMEEDEIDTATYDMLTYLSEATVMELALLCSSIVYYYLMLFAPELQIYSLYPLPVGSLVLYLVGISIIVATLVVGAVFLHHTQELKHGWRIFQYLEFTHQRSSTHGSFWHRFRSVEHDKSIHPYLRSVDALCFSVQYGIVLVFFAAGSVVGVFGIEMAVRAEYVFGNITMHYNMFADPLSLLVIGLIFLGCALSKRGLVALARQWNKLHESRAARAHHSGAGGADGRPGSATASGERNPVREIFTQTLERELAYAEGVSGDIGGDDDASRPGTSAALGLTAAENADGLAAYYGLSNMQALEYDGNEEGLLRELVDNDPGPAAGGVGDLGFLDGRVGIVSREAAPVDLIARGRRVSVTGLSFSDAMSLDDEGLERLFEEVAPQVAPDSSGGIPIGGGENPQAADVNELLRSVLEDGLE